MRASLAGGELVQRPGGQLGVGEGAVIVFDGQADAGVIGMERLHQHLAAMIATTGTAGDLGKQLERPLRSTEVGQMQRLVSVDDAHQRDGGHIEPFGNHLRAKEDAYFAALKRFEDLRVAARFLGSVRIHTGSVHAGELHGEFLFELFGAQTIVTQTAHAAGGAAFGRRGLVATVMADDAAGHITLFAFVALHRSLRCCPHRFTCPSLLRSAMTMVGHGDVTELALQCHATVGAEEAGIEATPIEKEDYLAIGGEHCLMADSRLGPMAL